MTTERKGHWLALLIAWNRLLRSLGTSRPLLLQHGKPGMWKTRMRKLFLAKLRHRSRWDCLVYLEPTCRYVSVSKRICGTQCHFRARPLTWEVRKMLLSGREFSCFARPCPNVTRTGTLPRGITATPWSGATAPGVGLACHRHGMQCVRT